MKSFSYVPVFLYDLYYVILNIVNSIQGCMKMTSLPMASGAEGVVGGEEVGAVGVAEVERASRESSHAYTQRLQMGHLLSFLSHDTLVLTVTIIFAIQFKPALPALPFSRDDPCEVERPT